MQIAKAESIWIKIPVTHDGPPSGFGGTIWTDVSTLLIRIETEDGLVGWGEAFGHNAIPATKAAFDHQIALSFIPSSDKLFHQISNSTAVQQSALSDPTSLSSQVWFSNRRAKHRREQKLRDQKRQMEGGGASSAGAMSSIPGGSASGSPGLGPSSSGQQQSR